MLTQFSVTNFRCIKEKATLDMRSITLTEYQNSLINNRLLPIAAIYGPNGGGKSTLLKALFTVWGLIAKHFIAASGTTLSNESIVPFKFDVCCKDKPTEFELFIEQGEFEYKYNLAVIKDKIVEESLHFRKIGSKVIKEIFTRQNGKITLGTAIINQVKLGGDIADSMSVLAWIGMVYKVEHVENLKKWFMTTVGVDYNIPFQDEWLLNNIYQLEIRNDEYSARIKNKVLQLLHCMDLNIASYRAEKVPIGPTQYNVRISTTHNIDDVLYELDLREESNGTRKAFGLMPLFVIALEEGRCVIIDELDAKMHPQLLKFIIKLFTDKNTNPKGAQLIFTSHDLTTMTKEVFRRDEIWFMAMGEQEHSALYSLIDIRTEDGNLVRPDASFNKQYIEGRYGADPYLNAIKHWGE